MFTYYGTCSKHCISLEYSHTQTILVVKSCRSVHARRPFNGLLLVCGDGDHMELMHFLITTVWEQDSLWARGPPIAIYLTNVEGKRNRGYAQDGSEGILSNCPWLMISGMKWLERLNFHALDQMNSTPYGAKYLLLGTLRSRIRRLSRAVIVESAVSVINGNGNGVGRRSAFHCVRDECSTTLLASHPRFAKGTLSPETIIPFKVQ